MTTCVYIASAEAHSGKSAIGVGLLAQMTRRSGRVGVFRPLVDSGAQDRLLSVLHPRSTSPLSQSQASGVTYDALHADPEAAMTAIVDRYHAYAAHHEAVLVVGSDFTDITDPAEFAVNADIAANIGATMVLVVPGNQRPPRETALAASLAVTEAKAHHALITAVVANRVDDEDIEGVRAELTAQLAGIQSYAVPDSEVLKAPTVGDLMNACRGTLWRGREDFLGRETTGVVVAAMQMPHVLEHLYDGALLVTPADREEVLLAALLAHRSTTLPTLSGIVLNGNFKVSRSVERLIDGIDVELPIITCSAGTMHTATALSNTRGHIRPDTIAKIDAALSLVEQHIDTHALLADLDIHNGDVVTPLMFEHRLVDRARDAGAHIVLPEGTEDRIILAAGKVLARQIAELTILGPPDAIRSRAKHLGVSVDGARLIDPETDPLLEQYAAEYHRLRAHRGVTEEYAHEVLLDPTYFGTMMVQSGDADGMVSGSITTTAHTIRPALQVIRTRPDTSIVSSVFFMCLADRVLVYGDCAVNPHPDAAQLADIAISSARTAASFGIEPRVAMLSYSTGNSGSGAEVEKVREATALVRAREPELLVDGPLQYDTAVDPVVAAAKMPDSLVAGSATVLIFPDLNTGNNTYKAVQRSAQAVAIGPVLQGLNQPINDLSRGALVRDIVNTIAITAVQTHP